MGKHKQNLYPSFGEEFSVYSASSHGAMNGTLFDRIQDTFGPIDVYVHDLGIGSLNEPLPDAWETDPDLARSLDVNLSCAEELAHCLTKRMPNKPWGRVIYLAPWAWDQYIDKIRFDTVSAGAMALTRSLSEALAPTHISVNCVVPGFIKTLRPSDLQKAKTDEAKAMVPSSQLGEISDVTNVVLFLSGDDSRYLTNQVLRVAGGY
jgi:3-oxoacyl-[acyl-carrier protein] reductase